MLPAIFALESTKITDDERALFKSADPLGFILFGRNINTPDQVKALTTSLKDLMGRDCPILIDQEGGRVQRLKPPHWAKWPAAGDYQQDYKKLYDDMYEMAQMLLDHGINVNCAPVLDIRYNVPTDIIGDRAYSDKADEVIKAGQVVCDAFNQAGIIAVSKHLPGHGRARADTHFKEAVINTPLATLQQTDFLPFQKVAVPWGMIAHVILSDVDSLPATLSPKVIDDIIRRDIGFDGILISDDLSMKALSAHGNIDQIALKCLQAGCDIALYCDGKLKDMEDIANALAPMDNSLKLRLGRFA
jgi:beta-N-acetylhexosaminidase